MPQSDPPERRARPRRRIAVPCLLDLGPSRERIPGILRELDDGGARVKIGSRKMTVAGKVRLQAGSVDQGCFLVVWQSWNVVGLQALSRLDQAGLGSTRGV